MTEPANIVTYCKKVFTLRIPYAKKSPHNLYKNQDNSDEVKNYAVFMVVNAFDL